MTPGPYGEGAPLPPQPDSEPRFIPVKSLDQLYLQFWAAKDRGQEIMLSSGNTFEYDDLVVRIEALAELAREFSKRILQRSTPGGEPRKPWDWDQAAAELGITRNSNLRPAVVTVMSNLSLNYRVGPDAYRHRESLLGNAGRHRALRMPYDEFIAQYPEDVPIDDPVEARAVALRRQSIRARARLEELTGLPVREQGRFEQVSQMRPEQLPEHLKAMTDEDLIRSLEKSAAMPALRANLEEERNRRMAELRQRLDILEGRPS